ncbi:MAG: hypothetical protein SVM79_09110 [Chloroflexota bacterium]|nr:hypothetical protein [Chloroflexota bacterium]
MTHQKPYEEDVKTHRRWILHLAILLGIVAIVLLGPIVATPVLGVALITGGIVAYRRSLGEGTIRTIAIFAIAGGVVLILIFGLVILFLVAV